MKRILLMVIRNIFMVPYGWIRLCYRAAHVDKYTEEEMYTEEKIFRIKMVLCFSQTIRDCMMCLPL